jgi:hypothetical protein
MFAFFAPGPIQLIFVIMMSFIIIWPTCKIVGKAGFPSWLGLFIIVPLGNIALLLFLAFADWPALQQDRWQDPQP